MEEIKDELEKMGFELLHNNHPFYSFRLVKLRLQIREKMNGDYEFSVFLSFRSAYLVIPRNIGIHFCEMALFSVLTDLYFKMGEENKCMFYKSLIKANLENYGRDKS